MLVVDLGKWMNKTLINWGIDPAVADRFDETIMALLMIVVAIVLNYLCQAILIGGMKQYTRRKPHQWNTLLMKRRVFHNLIHTIPAFLVYSLLPMAFIRGKELLLISQKACVIYIIFSLLLAINGILLMIMDIYDGRESMKDRPMKGFIQVLQVLLFFVGGIVIIAIIVNKSPATLFAGLGASAAILMLVFKDSILGFVAGIQLSANDMVRTVLFMHDIIIPRDASQQAYVGERIEITSDFANVQRGDLVFFGRKAFSGRKEGISHVGIYLGNKQFIHALGDVHISSFEPADKNYDEFNTGRLLFAVRFLPYINKEKGMNTTEHNPHYLPQ